jgi:CO dehydrogenase/acetyl-CoA synthase alpha subunit
VWTGLGAVAYLSYQEQAWTLIPWTAFAGLIYELFFVPTRCAARTRDGGSCDKNARGRLGACGLKAHQQKKRDAIWHYVTGLRNPLARFRKTWGNIEVDQGEVVSTPMPGIVEKANRPGSLEKFGIILALISAAAGVISAVHDLLN